MLGKYSYWLFKGKEGLNKKNINKIIKIFKKEKIKKGVIGKDERIDKSVRDSNITFSNEAELYDIVCPYIHAANKSANWNVDIALHESMQFTIYNKNQHYDWHIDSLDEPYGNQVHPDLRGKIRKLSCCISLTDSKKYEGGDFYFHFGREQTPYKISGFKEQGSILIFPSFIWHKVSPITKGTRYSLVNWSIGAPWK